MNSQEDYTEIGQEQILSFGPDLATNYSTFAEIQKIKNTSPTLKGCLNCAPAAFFWTSEHSQQSSLHLDHSNPHQWLITDKLSRCCMKMELGLKFSLKRGMQVQIVKIAPRNGVFVEEGIKYKIMSLSVMMRVQICVNSEGRSKIWKQIDMPKKSLQIEPINQLIIQEQPSGECRINLNGFDFVVSLPIAHSPQIYLCLKIQQPPQQIKFGLSPQSERNDHQGCKGQACVLF